MTKSIAVQLVHMRVIHQQQNTNIKQQLFPPEQDWFMDTARKYQPIYVYMTWTMIITKMDQLCF